MVNLRDVKDSIKKDGWYHFGKTEGHICHAISNERIDEYAKTHKLASPCDRCFKMCVFWEEMDKDNLQQAVTMFKRYNLPRGKINDDVLIFYFTNKNDMEQFAHDFSYISQKYLFKCRVRFRRACKIYDDILKPY